MEGSNKEESKTTAIIDEQALNQIKDLAAEQFHSWTREHNGKPFCPMTNWTVALGKYLNSKGVPSPFIVKGYNRK